MTGASRPLRDLYRRWSEARRRRAGLHRWEGAGFAPPAPTFVKRKVFERHALPDATWVETGTFRGDTAEFLSRSARRVVTIEPEPQLFAAARERFRGSDRVEVVNGPSEEVLPRLVPSLEGNVCFWLDGHHSGKDTFLGETSCPILAELAAIGAQLPRWKGVVVLVDDVRLFGAPEEPGYPPLHALVDWARQHGLRWVIEHDIFVARKDG